MCRCERKRWCVCVGGCVRGCVCVHQVQAGQILGDWNYKWNDEVVST